jgi:hypothetical protein
VSIITAACGILGLKGEETTVKATHKRTQFAALGVVMAMIILGVLVFTGWYAYHSQQVANASLQNANKVSSDIPKVAPITTFDACKKAGSSKILQTYPEQCVTKAGKRFTDSVALKTYASKTEKASFRYPTTWQVADPAAVSSDPKADTLGLKSPNGKVTVSWVSLVDGLGGACSPDVALGVTSDDGLGACPSSVITGSTPISGVSGLVVAEGYITSDNKAFHPWMAVVNKEYAVSRREMGYEVFSGRNNGKFSVLFAIGGIGKSSDMSFASANQVEAFLASDDANTARQILLSLQY